MDETDYTTEHRKGQHLSLSERYEIEVHRRDGWSIYQISKHMGRPYNTIKNEIKRGTVVLYNGKVKRYKASTGQETYQEHRQQSRRKYRTLVTIGFQRYVQKHFTEDHWSLDACVGRATLEGGFERSEIVCTKTLYNYVDLGLLPLTNMDLPEKLHRSQKRHFVRENRKSLGKSIEERPKDIDDRKDCGNWEIDSVLGKQGENEPAVVSLTERKTRISIWMKVRDHSAEAVNEALKDLFSQFGSKYLEVFRTITGDNGSEFADLAVLEAKGIGVYFTHPFSSFEKGTVECHNRMLRRFIPKGKSIDDYTADDIMYFADVINGLPRKELGYHTPEELFEAELDRIYAA